MAEWEMEATRREADAIAALALAGVSEKTGEGQYTLIPHGSELQDLEEFHTAPRRKAGTVTLHETTSFVAYVDKHKDSDSAVYCDRKRASFVAVLDAHTAESPRWCGHRALLTLQKTPEWETWVSHNKHTFDQVKFAEFLEANLPDIVEPVGADLLEMALALEEKRNITFSSAVRLADGQRQFTYNEEVQGKGKTGQVNIPSQFKLEIAPFFGAPEQKLRALLRYRIKEGLLTFSYDIERVEEVERVAVEDAAKLIGDQTSLLVLYGIPNGPQV